MKTYKNREEFKKENPKQYNWLIKNRPDLLDKHLPVKETKSWDYESCKEESLKYNSVSDWRKYSQSSITRAKKQGWFDELSAHMEKADRISWTKEKCMEIASKYSSRKEWRKNDRKSYDYACDSGILDECTSHMTRLKRASKWSIEDIKKDAAQYSTKTEWMEKNSLTYKYAHLHNIVDECSAHMEKLQETWTYEKCLADAKLYGTVMNWQKNNQNSLNAAYRNKWIDDFKPFLKKSNNYKTKPVKCVQTGIVYSSAPEAAKQTGLNKKSIHKAITTGNKCGGFNWIYE